MNLVDWVDLSKLINLVAIGIMFSHLKSTEHPDSTEAIFLAILFSLVVMSFSTISGPDGWLSEAFPKNAKFVGLMIDTCSNMLRTHLVPLIMCLMQGWTFFFFGGGTFLMSLFVFFFIPETEEIPED